jgi:hypothetical protein
MWAGRGFCRIVAKFLEAAWKLVWCSEAGLEAGQKKVEEGRTLCFLHELEYGWEARKPELGLRHQKDVGYSR